MIVATPTPMIADPDFALRDNPTQAFIEDLRRRFPTERETDALLVRKMQRRSGPPYRHITLEELTTRLRTMLSDLLGGDFEISEQKWLTGGASKVQMAFLLAWTEPGLGRRTERLVIRMDPSEASNTPSRLTSFERSSTSSKRSRNSAAGSLSPSSAAFCCKNVCASVAADVFWDGPGDCPWSLLPRSSRGVSESGRNVASTGAPTAASRRSSPLACRAVCAAAPRAQRSKRHTTRTGMAALEDGGRADPP